MSQPGPSRGHLCSMWALSRAACPVRRKNIDFFSLWITRLDRLGRLPWVRLLPLSAGCLCSSQAYTSKYWMFSHCPVFREQLTAIQRLVDFIQWKPTYWLINNHNNECNVQSGRLEDWADCEPQSAGASIDQTASHNRVGFWTFLTVPHLEIHRQQLEILHSDIEREEFQCCLTWCYGLQDFIHYISTLWQK